MNQSKWLIEIEKQIERWVATHEPWQLNSRIKNGHPYEKQIHETQWNFVTW
jgi:hypothetical protein